MAYRVFNLNLISAVGLKDVNLLTNMAPYAIASLSNDPKSKQTTSVDKDGGKSPTWNSHMTFFIPTANPDGLFLHIQIKSKRTFGASDVGEVHIPIPIKELLLEGTAKFVPCQVIKPSGKPEGILNISYQIGDEVTAYPAAVTGPNAYPPPAGAYPYPPPQPAYWNGAPQPQPQPGYAYWYPPQPQPGYGYGYPPQAAKPKKNRLWMALRACLLCGDLGGDDFIGEMIYDAGDSGFADDGGFDL